MGAKTPEVLAAEAAHFAAKGAIPAIAPYAGYPYAGAYAYGAGYLGYNGYNGYPYAGALVAHPNGAVVPADTPAQVAAKAEHFAAKDEVYAAQGYAPYAHGFYGHGYAPYAHGLAPYAYAHPAAYIAGAPGLVAHPNGALVPAE